ncbi:MAG: adenylate kinase, partial [Elusimicrobiota bacterium]
MRIILLGAPGSGKGTQAARLAGRCAIPHVSTGDIFRDEIARKTELGRAADDYVKSGRLVPDHLVLKMVIARLERPDCVDGFLLDGFPRTIEQAKGLNDYLAKKGVRINFVFYLEGNAGALVERLSGRRYCPGCQTVYNVMTNLPKVEGVCDRCGGKLIIRSDDDAGTIRRRLMVYEDLTSPLVAYFKATESFLTVDACRP